MGMCTFEVCEEDSLAAFDTFYIQASLATLKNNFTVPSPPVNVETHMTEIRAARLPGFWVMISIFTTALILCSLGIVV